MTQEEMLSQINSMLQPLQQVNASQVETIIRLTRQIQNRMNNYRDADGAKFFYCLFKY